MSKVAAKKTSKRTSARAEAAEMIAKLDKAIALVVPTSHKQPPPSIDLSEFDSSDGEWTVRGEANTYSGRLLAPRAILTDTADLFDCAEEAVVNMIASYAYLDGDESAVGGNGPQRENFNWHAHRALANLRMARARYGATVKLAMAGKLGDGVTS